MQRIAIVGGGTAGWMAALLFAHLWQDFEVTLIEAPDIPTVGVGEGSTPALKKYFDFLGVHETEWMAATGATYKTGIQFSGWSGRPGYENYFHAFDSALDLHTEPAFLYNCTMRRLGVDVDAKPDHYFINACLAQAKRLPTPNENFPFATGYGYHFDAGLLSRFLVEKATSLGVRHLRAKVLDVPVNGRGISALVLDDGARFEADLYVDCTGFARLLATALKIEFDTYAPWLLNDRAVVLSTDAVNTPAQYTRAQAMPQGWMWQIPLRHRTGFGYVFSSNFCSPDVAENQLREQLGLPESYNARHLRLQVGRLREHWHKNCLVLGLSQGFIEPLEATALNLVQTAIEQFADAWELGRFTDQNRVRYNQKINEHFDGVRDYILAHYLASARADTEYWRAATRVPATPALAEVMQLWCDGGDVQSLLAQPHVNRFYTPMSWFSLLSGYGLYMPRSQLRPGTAKANRYPLKQVQTFLRTCMAHYPLVK